MTKLQKNLATIDFCAKFIFNIFCSQTDLEQGEASFLLFLFYLIVKHAVLELREDMQNSCD